MGPPTKIPQKSVCVANGQGEELETTAQMKISGKKLATILAQTKCSMPVAFYPSL